MRWAEFEAATPEIAAVGKRLLYAPDHGEVGLLATVDAAGAPRLAPVCPIFRDPGIYLLVGKGTPKRRHLDAAGTYAMHALVGADDEEFQFSGNVRLVTQATERDAVIEAIPFSAYDATDPIYELLIERALNVTWSTPGEPIRRSWSARSRSG